VIRIGPAGWKYKDWEGVVYPQPAPRGFDALAYIAEYFTTVEINSSYYGPPQPKAARRWVNSVSQNRDFRFTAKLYHSFTHERKPEFGDERDYKAGIAPIAEAERLGASWFNSRGHSRMNRRTGSTSGAFKSASTSIRSSSKSATRAGLRKRFWILSQRSGSGCAISTSRSSTVQ
jgi:Protein of unknown function DUF72